MPQLLCDEMREYLEMFYSPNDSDRIFPISKSYLHHEMDRGSKSAGVKRIRIHDLRHSHVSLLINQGYQAAAIADRVGHETVEITDRYTHIYPSKQNEMANTLTPVSASVFFPTTVGETRRLLLEFRPKSGNRLNAMLSFRV